MDAQREVQETLELLGQILQVYRLRDILLKRRQAALGAVEHNVHDPVLSTSVAYLADFPGLFEKFIAKNEPMWRELEYCLSKERRLLDTLVVQQPTLEHRLSLLRNEVYRHMQELAYGPEDELRKALKVRGIGSTDLLGTLSVMIDFLDEALVLVRHILKRIEIEEKALRDRSRGSFVEFLDAWTVEVRGDKKLRTCAAKAMKEIEPLHRSLPSLGLFAHHVGPYSFRHMVKSAFGTNVLDGDQMLTILITGLSMGCLEFFRDWFDRSANAAGINHEQENILISRLESALGVKHHWWK